MTHDQLSRKSVRLSGITTAYLDSGQGEPIAALHGIPTSSLLFAPLLSGLSHYRLIAPDLLGQGQTEAPPVGSLGYSAYAGHLRAFMNAVPPQRSHLLIHIFPLQHASSIVQALPQAKMFTIKRCGHWSPLDAPDDIAQFMVKFFSANGHS